MIRYFDSSALAKRYVSERGSARVARLARESEVATTRLSIIEVTSALTRRHREGELSGKHVGDALAKLETDTAAWLLVELNDRVAGRASKLLLEHMLRASDAVQLASCLLLRETFAPEIELVTYDDRLATAAKAVGLKAV